MQVTMATSDSLSSSCACIRFVYKLLSISKCEPFPVGFRVQPCGSRINLEVPLINPVIKKRVSQIGVIKSCEISCRQKQQRCSMKKKKELIICLESVSAWMADAGTLLALSLSCWRWKWPDSCGNGHRVQAAIIRYEVATLCAAAVVMAVWPVSQPNTLWTCVFIVSWELLL